MSYQRVSTDLALDLGNFFDGIVRAASIAAAAPTVENRNTMNASDAIGISKPISPPALLFSKIAFLAAIGITKSAAAWAGTKRAAAAIAGSCRAFREHHQSLRLRVRSRAKLL